jgi:type III pantothenate kinase
MEGVVSAAVFGMRIAYSEPSKLGVDRWLAMFSAFSDHPSQYVAVVDAGTALKIDIINSNGVHLGGSISMGLSLSYSTLNRNTAQLPHVKEQFDGKLGKNTEGCINYGVIMSAIAIIEKTIRELDRKCCVILTGGDADVISSYLNLEHCVTDNLTLKGLRLLSERGFIKLEGTK